MASAVQGLKVAIYPAITSPKNYAYACALINNKLQKWKASVLPKIPPSIALPEVNSPQDWITHARVSGVPELQLFASRIEGAINKHNAKLAATKGNGKATIFPVALWKQVLPAEYVDAYHEYLDLKYEETWDRSDVLPWAQRYLQYLDYELPQITIQIDQLVEAYEQLLPLVEQADLQKKKIESGDISVEQLLADFPDIAQEIGEELERGDWTIDGSGPKPGEEDDHHGHH